MKLPIDGNEIREGRHRLNMSARRLSMLMDVSENCINSWERGEAGVRGITRANWAKLKHILDPSSATVDPDDDLTNGPVTPAGRCVLRLALGRDMAAALVKMAASELRIVENQAIWSIRTTLESYGYLATGREE